MPKAKKPKQQYGIAEWYGRLYRALSDAERKQFAAAPFKTIECPFLRDVPSLGPKNGSTMCNKKGGVCSIRTFKLADGANDYEFGETTVTCPNRFLENALVATTIGEALLGTVQPLFAKEIPFLRRPSQQEAAKSIEQVESEEANSDEIPMDDPGSENVGRIDLVFMSDTKSDLWCAVEMQAVYFSGDTMAKDINVIKSFSGNGIPAPGGTRRPDYRSSGPKRLMPQLMIKVPTLRRWGKKMVVVIDRPFFTALDHMDEADHPSNSDIAWIVVRLDEVAHEERAQLAVDNVYFTTLDDAVKGLTAGKPTTLPEFEEKLSKRVRPIFGSDNQ